MEIAHGRYRLIRRLGEGGTGIVYQAADLLLGRTVAVKELRPAFDTALLRREGQSLAHASHPGVVSLHDLVEHGGRPYLVMEYVDGCNLEQWLTGGQDLSPERALQIFIRIAEIVAAAHELGVLHCDLKPANVLLSTSGEVKLTDFTLARLARRGEFPGDAGGSERYTAPEVLRGGTVDRRADVYSLGAILRRLLGSLEGASPLAAQVRNAIVRATAALPEDRYATVADLLADLPAAGSDLTHVAGRSAVSDLTRILPRPPGRPAGRALGPVAMAAAALVIAGAAISTRFPAAASPARVTLPDLVATQSRSAQLVARSLQLRYGVHFVYSSSVPAGVVMRQWPRPNTEIERHSLVTVDVSKGPAPIALPDLDGMQSDAASALLSRLGFRVALHTVDDITHDSGTVLGQSPDPHALEVPGATVTLTVSHKPWWWIF
jgi:serine/threonine-protein kinase